MGVTDYCVHPADAVAQLPKLGGTKNPNLDRICELRPDFVLANKEENRRATVERLEASGLTVFVTYARTLHTALREIHTLGRLTECEREARAIAERIEASWAEARARAREPRPSVAALVWKGPYMAVGADTFAHAMLVESGGDNPFASEPARYPRIDERDLERVGPEVILLPTEPYAFEELDRIDLLRLDCPAAHAGRIHIVEGELLTWYGPRMARALDVLSALLCPD